MEPPAVKDIHIVEGSFWAVNVWDGGVMFFFVHRWVEDRTKTPWEGFYIDGIETSSPKKADKKEVTLRLRNGKIYAPALFGKTWRHVLDSATPERVAVMSAKEWEALEKFWNKHRDAPAFPGSEDPPGELLLEGRHAGIFKPSRPLF